MNIWFCLGELGEIGRLLSFSSKIFFCDSMGFYCFYLNSTNEIQCNRIFELDFVSGFCPELAAWITHNCMQSAWLVTVSLAFRDKYQHANLTDYMSIYFFPQTEKSQLLWLWWDFFFFCNTRFSNEDITQKSQHSLRKFYFPESKSSTDS